MTTQSLQSVYSKVASNINTKARPNNLIEVGNDINWLIEKVGDKKEVAKSLGISTGMLNKFLSVFKVSNEVRSQIENRKIDSIFSIHALKSLSEEDQIVVAKEMASKKFNSQEARSLIPLRNTFPNESIERLVNVIRATKDSKNYVNHFPYPADQKGLERISNRIEKVVDGEEFSLSANGNIGVFKITKVGNKKMREDASSKGMGFHSYLLTVFNPEGKM